MKAIASPYSEQNKEQADSKNNGQFTVILYKLPHHFLLYGRTAKSHLHNIIRIDFIAD